MAILALVETSMKRSDLTCIFDKVGIGHSEKMREGGLKPFPAFWDGRVMQGYSKYNEQGGCIRFSQTSTADIAGAFWLRATPRYETAATVGSWTVPGVSDGNILVFQSSEDATNPYEFEGTNKNSFLLSYKTSTFGNHITCNYWWSNTTANKVQQTTVGEPEYAFADGEWHWIEFRYKADNSTGIYQLYIDGTLIHDITATDTILGTTPPTFTGFDQVWLPLTCMYTSRGQFELSDLVIYDSSTTPTGCLTTSSFPLGQSYIKRLRADAAGSNSSWTKTSWHSGNYQLSQRSTRLFHGGGFLKTATNGAIDSYSFESISGTPTIKAVCVEVLAYATGPGDAYLQGYCKSSASTATSPSTLLPLSQQETLYVLEVSQDPNAAAAWTATTLNAAEFGFKYSST